MTKRAAAIGSAVFFLAAPGIEDLKTRLARLGTVFAQSAADDTVGMGNDADSFLGGDLLANDGKRVTKQGLVQE